MSAAQWRPLSSALQSERRCSVHVAALSSPCSPRLHPVPLPESSRRTLTIQKPSARLPGKLQLSCNDCLKAILVYCVSYALTNNFNDIYFLYTVTALCHSTYSKKYLLILNISSLWFGLFWLFVRGKNEIWL